MIENINFGYLRIECQCLHIRNSDYVQSHLFSQAISYKSNAGETQNRFQRNGLKDGHELFGKEHHSQPIGRSLKFHLTVLSV